MATQTPFHDAGRAITTMRTETRITDPPEGPLPGPTTTAMTTAARPEGPLQDPTTTVKRIAVHREGPLRGPTATATRVVAHRDGPLRGPMTARRIVVRREDLREGVWLACDSSALQRAAPFLRSSYLAALKGPTLFRRGC